MTAPAPDHGYLHNKHKDDYLKRLRRIEGQVRGLQRMVEDEKYCIDVVTQISAVTSALRSVALGLLDEHLGHCVVEAARDFPHQEQSAQTNQLMIEFLSHA